MATVFDVASYILQQQGPMTAMKLQKLIYYSQAWSLVWDEEPIFEDEFEAWANGPIVRALYDKHRGRFKLNAHDIDVGDPASLKGEFRDTINVVLEYYGQLTAQQLSDMTHSEDPWAEARSGLAPMAKSNAKISRAAMHEFYSSL